MSYNKTNWLDRAVQYPQRFTRTSDGTYDTLVPAPGTVAQSGTPITADALNNIENGIFNNDQLTSDHEIRLGKVEGNRAKIYHDTDGSLIMDRASVSIYGTNTYNANFIVGIQDTAHSGKYIVAVAHFQKNSILELTTIVAKTLTYVTNTLGTITVSGLSGDPKYTIIGLS
jgi:hypothetical protein